MIHQISKKIKANLDMLSIKDETSSRFLLQIEKKILGFLFKDGYFCEILLVFGLRAIILATFSLWGGEGRLD